VLNGKDVAAHLLDAVAVDSLNGGGGTNEDSGH